MTKEPIIKREPVIRKRGMGLMPLNLQHFANKGDGDDAGADGGNNDGSGESSGDDVE